MKRIPFAKVYSFAPVWKIPSNACVALTALILALPFLAFSSILLAKEPYCDFCNSGKDFVQETLPELTEAAVQVLGPQNAEKFFEGWTDEEVVLALQKFRIFFRKLQEDNKTIDENYRARASTILGVFGEIFGAIRLREEISENPMIPRHAIFVNDLFLDPERHLSPGNARRHDGVVFSIQNRSEIVVHRIFESKMGGEYDRKQGVGVFERWRTKGIYLNDQLFKPQRIILVDPISLKRIPIMLAKFELFRKMTFISGVAREASTRTIWSYYRIPFSGGPKDIYFLIGQRMAQLIAAGKTKDELIQSLQDRERKLTENYAQRLKKFLAAKFHRPSLTSGGSVGERTLALDAGFFPIADLKKYLNNDEKHILGIENLSCPIIYSLTGSVPQFSIE